MVIKFCYILKHWISIKNSIKTYNDDCSKQLALSTAFSSTFHALTTTTKRNFAAKNCNHYSRFSKNSSHTLILIRKFQNTLVNQYPC